MKHSLLSCLALGIGTLTSQAQTITTPPTDLGLDSYYVKYMNCNGIHIVTGDKAPDSCLVKVYRQIESMTDMLPKEVLDKMVSYSPRVIVMGRYEGITELPEYKDYPGIKPYWDIHCRGLEASEDLPVTLAAEENVLAYQIDPNYAEDILVKYFAKTVFKLGISKVYPQAEKQLFDLHTNATLAGKYKNTYAGGNMLEYFAEGVQDWLDVNAEAPLPNGEHNWVNTRADLKKYDSGLYDFIAGYFNADVPYRSNHTKSNLYKKDDAKAYRKLNKEKKLNIAVPECKVERVSEELATRLKLDTKFYKKHVDCNGIHILSSDQVPDSALAQAFKTIYCMTSMLPEEVLKCMAKVDTRVVVMGQKEVTIDVPEHSGMRHDRSLNWNLRARGLGGTLMEPITSCAEENIMAYPWDKYHAEDILIHEFSHSIHLIGILQVDPTINDQLQDLLTQALNEGKWKDTYAGSVYEEYWAEGVQDWFNVNAEVASPDGKHNPVNTREELKKYDPRLYKLISKYFPETNAQIGKHKKENKYKIKTR